MLFGLSKFVWIIDWLVTCLSPHPKAPTHPSTPEMLRAKERTPTPFSSFSLSNSHLSFSKNVEVHQLLPRFPILVKYSTNCEQIQFSHQQHIFFLLYYSINKIILEQEFLVCSVVIQMFCYTMVQLMPLPSMFMKLFPQLCITLALVAMDSPITWSN